MIKFFRKIRQKLLAENKFSKYMIYALGEIFLVMVGILLALQVNNWNETRRNNINESKILLEIAKNLETGSSWIKGGLITDYRSINSCRIIINHISKELPFHDSLLTHFYMIPNYGFISIPMSGYHSYKTGNSSLIRNDSIRIAISDIYEVQYPHFESIINDIDQRRHELLNSELYNHFKIRRKDLDDIKIGREPNNYEELLKDDRFESILRSVYDNKMWIKSEKEKYVQSIIMLKNQIMKEVAK